MTLLKKAVEIGFDKRQVPSGFLANLFEKKQLNTIKVEVQGRTVKAVYAVDVKLGTGGRRFDISSHDSREFIIPEYNEFAMITEEDMFKVRLGETEYSQTMANIANLINTRQELASDMIRRAENKQAADALFNGKIVLADGTEIVFNKKDSHNISKSSAKWDSTGNPIADIEAACDLIVSDAKVAATEFNFIASSAVISAFLANSNVKGSSSWNNGITRNNISMPIEKTPKAVYHGQISAGSNIVNIWGYNERYTIPTGYNFANEGTDVPYIPAGKAVILPLNPNFKRYYGAVNNTDSQGPMGGGALQLLEQEQVAYAYDVKKHGTAWTEAGVKSRVLLVPVDVDEIVTLTDLVS